jgi:hypothetical protein
LYRASVDQFEVFDAYFPTIQFAIFDRPWFSAA